MAAAADQVARVWMLDLRRKSFMEIGGTSRQQDIWACVRRRIETDPITECGVPVRLSPGQMMEVKRKARNLAANYVAADLDTVPWFQGDQRQLGERRAERYAVRNRVSNTRGQWKILR
jgi:hypothetical protein